VILRPVFFMENLFGALQSPGLHAGLGARVSHEVQMIAVDDIGWFGARAFTDAAALNRREIDLAGDVRTMPEAAQIPDGGAGSPIAFAQTPIEQVRQYSKDMAVMLEWFERVGYSADIPGPGREFGRALTKLPIGHAATRDQMGRLKESSHESCQIVGIRGSWCSTMYRRRRSHATRSCEDQEHRRQSSGSC